MYHKQFRQVQAFFAGQAAAKERLRSFFATQVSPKYDLWQGGRSKATKR